MNLSLPWQPPMGSRRKPPVASYFMCRSRVDSQKRHGTGPAPPTEARCRPESRESWRMRVAPTSPSTFPCLPLPCAESAGTGKGGRWSTVRCWSPRHTTSLAELRGPTAGSTWTRDGRRRQAGPIVGWPRHFTCTPGRSGGGSHRRNKRCARIS